MTQEYDNTIQDLLDWNICERNIDGEIKPTADFLVWYYGYLVHSVAESYGDVWEPVVDPYNITDEQAGQMDKDDKEREEFIKDCIENQIVGWTAHNINGKTYAHIGAFKHADIVYRLINEINDRLMDVHMRKSGSIDS